MSKIYTANNRSLPVINQEVLKLRRKYATEKQKSEEILTNIVEVMGDISFEFIMFWYMLFNKFFKTGRRKSVL